MATAEDWKRYHEAKDRHEQELVEYEVALKRWDSLTPEQKNGAHAQAEVDSRKFWSVLVVIAASIVMFLGMRHAYSGDQFWLYWGGASAAALVVCIWTSRFLGLIARSAFFATLFGGLCFFGFVLAQKFLADPPSQFLQNMATAIVAIAVFCRGMMGKHQASGYPQPPMPPSRPT